ncbi:MAG: hypothetical protein O7B30_01820 [Thaumarchaeota archaeon]|nr:hypothetical protein [Nitrososphaerota archaeon]MCZ6724798.1 hypothetical protein [Nitrososphaerota archaeon]
MASIFYAMRLVYIKSGGFGYVAIEESEDRELDFSSRLAWLDSANLSNIFRTQLSKYRGRQAHADFTITSFGPEITGP